MISGFRREVANNCALLGYYAARQLTGGADKSLAQPTSRCNLFDGENISFDASLFIYK